MLARETTPLAEASDELRRQVLGEQRQVLVDEELRATASEVEVDVNPRFGRWDLELVQVVPVPDDDGLSKPAPDRGTPGGAVPQGPRGQPGAPEGQPLPEGEPAPTAP